MAGSDVGQRLPAFKEMRQETSTSLRRGHFEGVPFAISPYLEGMEPVGLSSDGTVVLPSGYDPQNGPAVLMLQPGEEGREIEFNPWNDAEMAAAKRSFNEVGIPVHGLHNLARAQKLNLLLSRGGVLQSIATVGPNVAYPQRIIALTPRLLTIAPGMQASVSLVGHELDHWDYALHGLVRDMYGGGHNYPNMSWLVARTEKRAHRTSFTIERNLGIQALGDISEIAQDFKGWAPYSMARLHDRLLQAQQQAGTDMVRATTLAPAVLVAEELFSSPEEPVTYHEYSALISLGAFDDKSYG